MKEDAYRAFTEIRTSQEEKGPGALMIHTADNELHRRTIECPVCQAQGAMLRHDIRASLVYFCERCQHEWQIDPVEEPLEEDPRYPPDR